MTDLRSELADSLTANYPGARWLTLAGDASTRRFHRLFLPAGETRVVMDYGKAFEGETDDIRLTRIFEDARLRVARILQLLPEAGALILEDLGDDTLESSLSRVSAEDAIARTHLYRSAIQVAAEMATRGTKALSRSQRAHGPALDVERFSFEMNYFLEHYVGRFLGRASIPTGLRDALMGLAGEVASHPRVLCHRDYHSRNIMVTRDGTLALVDIQDARWGPDTYDLASLLRDAYVELGDESVEELAAHYWGLLPRSPNLVAFRARFDLVAAQRMIKALGTFGYQVAVLGRDRYRDAISRTVERLGRLLPGFHSN
jgi:aminoglycoside/choline kinase family phosphotransferase